ncbi:MAG: hypothetical protein KMY50_06990, partial [Candidatus Desulforudis sp.]|nr:hypothetical protein [Desulforudis sp.]
MAQFRNNFSTKVYQRAKIYNPDFDSKRGEKEAATLANKGVAAFIWFQKYVGEYLIFCCWL